MADKKPVVTARGGRPGLKGAFADAVEAIAGVTAPRSVVQRKVKIEESVDPDRYRRNQTTDSNN